MIKITNIYIKTMITHIFTGAGFTLGFTNVANSNFLFDLATKITNWRFFGPMFCK